MKIRSLAPPSTPMRRRASAGAGSTPPPGCARLAYVWRVWPNAVQLLRIGGRWMPYDTAGLTLINSCMKATPPSILLAPPLRTESLATARMASPNCAICCCMNRSSPRLTTTSHRFFLLTAGRRVRPAAKEGADLRQAFRLPSSAHRLTRYAPRRTFC